MTYDNNAQIIVMMRLSMHAIHNETLISGTPKSWIISWNQSLHRILSKI